MVIGAARYDAERQLGFLPMPSRDHSASRTLVPPSGRDSVVNPNPSADAARAASGSRNRVRDAARRWSASRFAASSRPKL
jgi:hypothetical protein